MHRKLAAGYAVVLALVALLNYLPGIPRPDGRVFGIFALGLNDDLLHLASAIWAGGSAWWGAGAARAFLLLFGAAYLSDGLLGLATGVGWLDLAIWTLGRQDYDLTFRVLANAPHLVLGGVALVGGLLAARGARP